MSDLVERIDEHHAHQRRIAELLREEEPIAAEHSLGGFSVEMVTKADAVPLISKYEWLGNIGRANTFVGMWSPRRKLYGVACFGFGPGGHIRRMIGEPALCLERGACVHYAPKNAASWLISNACKLVYNITGTSTFYAYGDPAAGEYGGVYQAANWVYLGQGLAGNGVQRAMRRYVLPPGLDAGDPKNWKQTRALRQGGRNLKFAEAIEQGWQVAWRPGKHVYATDVGRRRRAWRKTIQSREYPCPRPELKMKSRKPGEDEDRS